MGTRLITNIIKGSRSLPELEDVVIEWGSSFDHIHVSAAFVKAAKLAKSKSAAAYSVVGRLTVLWNTVQSDAQAWGLANVLWASSKLRLNSAELWSSTLAAFVQAADGAACQDLCNVAYALAVISNANKGAVPGVSRQDMESALGAIMEEVYIQVMHPLLEGVTAQDVANVLWAFGKLQFNPGTSEVTALLKAVVKPQLLDNITPQAVANILLGIAWLASCQPAALDHRLAAESAKALLGHVVLDHKSWCPQAITNCMWACSKLGLQGTAFMQAAADTARVWVRQAEVKDVVQAAWACGILQFGHEQLMHCLVTRAEQLLKGLPAHASSRAVGLVAAVSWSIMRLNMQQLARATASLLVVTSVQRQLDRARLHRSDAGYLWYFHTWLVDNQLVDGQGLRCALSEQQLAVIQRVSEQHNTTL